MGRLTLNVLLSFAQFEREVEVEAQFVKAADAIEAVSSKLKTRALSQSLLSAEPVRAVHKALGRQPPLPIA